MSRLTWMTYLKYLFDKLKAQNNSMNQNVVDANQLYEAFLRIKEHLPLLNKDDYFLKHGSERGFTVRDIESSLKRLVIIKK